MRGRFDPEAEALHIGGPRRTARIEHQRPLFNGTLSVANGYINFINPFAILHMENF